MLERSHRASGEAIVGNLPVDGSDGMPAHPNNLHAG
jgi:hypothetical protein